MSASSEGIVAELRLPDLKEMFAINWARGVDITLEPKQLNKDDATMPLFFRVRVDGTDTGHGVRLNPDGTWKAFAWVVL